MSQNKFLYEQLAIERYRELEREREHMHLLTSLPRHHQGVGRHIVSRLGALLVAVGTRLEQVEQREGQGIRPVDDSVGELRALAAPHPAGAIMNVNEIPRTPCRGRFIVPTADLSARRTQWHVRINLSICIIGPLRTRHRFARRFWAIRQQSHRCACLMSY